MFNVEFLLPAILLGIVGGFNFNFSEAKRDFFLYLRVWLTYGAIVSIVSLLIFWLFQPAIVAPYANIFWFLTAYWLIGLFIAGDREDDLPVAGMIIYVLFLGSFIVVALDGSAIFNAKAHQQLIGPIKEANWTEDIAPIDESKMRVVSQEQAQYLADKILGESKEVLGAKYKVGDVDICNVNGEIIWVAPLEFRDFWKWKRFRTAPGYIIVSAEDNNRQPILIDTLELRYIRSAFWKRNLRRHVYSNGYNNYKLQEISLELDDDYNPYYVITATAPTISFFGQKTKGIIIVDPKTGQIEWQDFGDVYAWIDRVMPEDIAESYISKWGRYVNGFWNTLFAQEGMIGPTKFAGQSNCWFVPDKDNKNYWFTGLTSVSQSDQSLVGVMMINTQTGEAKRYALSGPDESAIIDAVSQALGADGQNWKATQPIPYNIYGEFSFVVPVVGIQRPILQKIAIVKASNLNVAFGNNKRQALAEYRKIISSTGNIVAPTHESELQSIKGIVLRKGGETQEGFYTHFLLIDSHPNRLFSLGSGVSPEIIITKERDSVAITFIQTREDILQVVEFDNLGIHLEQSESQIKYSQAREDNRKVLEALREEKKFDLNFENLSSEEKKNLLEIYKKQNK